ncbi:MAG TPA: aminotransferase class V-fold PLP-dependent enzyme [Steroidobacteraceae bacterium]|nr:aminotransferase class V-fold PLP-dependent enzyme [Steroidobacteraceae bacterium]
MSGAPIYLDYAATTPVDARVAAAMQECLTEQGVYANPSSQHALGRRAHACVEQAREQVAALLHCRAAELIFTSGATESNNLAILGTARAAGESAGSGRAARAGRVPHVVTARSEHKSVLDPCRRLEQEGCAVTYLNPDADGLIDPQAVRAALRDDTVLVSIMHANNEIGVVQDIGAIGALCRERGVPLHVDAAQSAGKLELDVARLQAELVCVTAHKLYGPKGIGALYVAPERRACLQPLLYGGGHERGLRAGTLPVHQIVGFGLACTLAAAELALEAERLARLRARLWQQLSGLDGVLLNGHPTRRLPGVLNVSFAGVEGESLLAGLPEIAVSTGSACNSDSDEPSYVLRALGRDTQLAQSSLRFSLGRGTREQHVDIAAAAVARELRRLRAVAP